MGALRRICRWLCVGLLVFVLACGRNAPQSEALPAATLPGAIATPVGAESTSPAAEATGTASGEGNQGTEAEPAAAEDEDKYAALREEMVREGIVGWGISDEAVIEAMRTVPRHEFVQPEWLAQAYENHPLPIGHGQTISQPYIVALMTQAAEVKPGDRVLEVGTGSGYQAAVLAELVDHVYTVEIIEPLADRAREVLERLEYENVTVLHQDGYFGMEEQAPFDAILVTAAPDHIPQPLVQQLKIGGRMVIPVGPVGGYQTLWLLTRESEEKVRTEDLGGVRFVPLTREDR